MAEHPMLAKILARFGEIAKVPRKSKEEQKICEWLVNWATTHKFHFIKDKVNNIIIQVPATQGYEHAETVILQGHMDMVCEKTPDAPKDPEKDGVTLVHDGEWLKADRTTLGADNGIAIAMATVLAEEKDIPHPALELLFTVDEETGLTGANFLESGVLKGKYLLNLDSEDEGIFTVGCAGGKTTFTTIKPEMCKVPPHHKPYELIVSKAKGGHSGVDIHCERANAIVVLARVLSHFDIPGDLFIADLAGGTAHNAIPRDVKAVVYLDDQDVEAIKHSVEAITKQIQAEYRNTDSELQITLTPSSKTYDKVMTEAQGKKVVDFLLAVPHGVSAMSTEIHGLVETSSNLAVIKIENEKLLIVTSQRSAVMSRLEALSRRIEALARGFGAEAKTGEGYPSWAPDMRSALLQRCKDVYVQTMHKEPKVEAIHAGLECGIIGGKYPGMDMISFGPTIKNPHSPSEMMYVPSVGLVWDFLVALLKSFNDTKHVA